MSVHWAAYTGDLINGLIDCPISCRPHHSWIFADMYSLVSNKSSHSRDEYSTVCVLVYNSRISLHNPLLLTVVLLGSVHWISTSCLCCAATRAKPRWRRRGGGHVIVWDMCYCVYRAGPSLPCLPTKLFLVQHSATSPPPPLPPPPRIERLETHKNYDVPSNLMGWWARRSATGAVYRIQKSVHCVKTRECSECLIWFGNLSDVLVWSTSWGGLSPFPQLDELCSVFYCLAQYKSYKQTRLQHASLRLRVMFFMCKMSSSSCIRIQKKLPPFGFGNKIVLNRPGKKIF